MTSDTVTFVESDSCDGTDVDMVASSQPYCILTITELRAEPYSLVQGDVVKAKVQARNVNGWGPISTENTVGALIEVEPHQMQQPQNGDGTSQSQIVVNWEALPDLESKGGVDVISYNLQWDKATNGQEWFDVIGHNPVSLDLTTTQTVNIVGGSWYQFRVRAENIHGLGPFSDSISIKAAQIPDRVSTPATTEILPTGEVQITWSEPHDGYQQITAYTIEFNSNSNGWLQSTEYCLGDNPSSLECTMPMLPFLAAFLALPTV